MGGIRGIAPIILNLCTRWKCVVRFIPSHFTPQDKCPGHPLNRKLGEPRSQPWCFGEDKGVLFLLEIEPQFLDVVSIPATLGHVA